MDEYSLKNLTDRLVTEIDKKQDKGNYVLKVNGSTPNSDGEITITTGNNEEILEAARKVTDVETDASVAEIGNLQVAVARVESNLNGVVRSVNGNVADVNGNVTVDVGGSGRGIGRGGLNISFNVASYNTYTIPSSGIATFGCSCNSDGVDVYIDGIKAFTQSPTDSWWEDEGGDTSSIVYYYTATFTMPVNANEVIGIVYKNKDYNRLYNGRYVERIQFSGSLMQLKVV